MQSKFSQKGEVETRNGLDDVMPKSGNGRFLPIAAEDETPEGELKDLHLDINFSTEQQEVYEEVPPRVPGFGGMPDSGSVGSEIIEVVTDVSLTFSFTSTFNADDIEYYEVVVCDNPFFTGDQCYTFQTKDKSTTLVLDDNNGFGAGCMANTETHMVYWMVRAVGKEFYAETFPNSTYYTPGVDNDKPSEVLFTTVAVEKDQIMFGWAPAYDTFGVEKYEIVCTSDQGDITTYMVDATNPLLIVAQGMAVDGSLNVVGRGLSDGVYSWKVRAVDYVGHVSKWSQGNDFVVDHSAPDWSRNDAGNSMEEARPLAWDQPNRQGVGGGDASDWFIGTIDGSASLSFTVSDYYSLNGGLTLNLYSSDGRKLKSYSVKPGTTTLDGFLWDVEKYGTQYYLEVLSKSSRTLVNYSIEANEHLFPDASPNSAFGTAEEVALDESGSGTASGWVGFGDAMDYYKFTTTGNGALTLDFHMQTPKTKYKVTLYNSAGKKLKSVTLNGDLGSVGNIFKSDILALKGDYYLSVESGDKGKGKQNGYYDFTVHENLFEAASSNSSFGAAESVTLDADGSGRSAEGWVGFGDAVDYYKFTTTEDGALSLDFHMRQQNAKTKYKVTLYNSAGKKLKSVTLNGDLGSVGNIFKSDILALKGDYYLSVESGDKGKGKQNGYYDFTVNSDYFLDPQEVNDGKAYTVSPDINTSFSGWVGFGDASDTYTLDVGPGSYSLSINGVTATLKVTLTDKATGKKLKSWTVKGDQLLLSPKLGNSLLKGDTLLTIEPADKGKGKQNSNYSVSIVENEAFPTETTANNDLAHATSVNFGEVNRVDLTDEWVGYGDTVDFFQFQLDSASRVDFDLNLDNKALAVGKQVKVKLYNLATRKTVRLDGSLSTLDALEAGNYAVSVEITKPEKNWSSYDLGISKLA